MRKVNSRYIFKSPQQRYIQWLFMDDFHGNDELHVQFSLWYGVCFYFWYQKWFLTQKSMMCRFSREVKCMDWLTIPSWKVMQHIEVTGYKHLLLLEIDKLMGENDWKGSDGEIEEIKSDTYSNINRWIK